MGVRMSQFGREMDKSKSGESLQAQHKKAVKRSQIKKQTKRQEYDEEGLLKRTKRRLRELYYGSKTYLPKKGKK